MSSQHQYMSVNNTSTVSRVGDIEHISKYHLSSLVVEILLCEPVPGQFRHPMGSFVPQH